MILATLLFLTVAYTSAQGFDCPAVPFNSPDNITVWSWYPNNFSNTQPPLFPNDYNCNYKIKVPQGLSVVIRLFVNLTVPQDRAVAVQVFDQNQNREAVYSANDEHFFFIAGGGSIQLNTRDQNVHFGFAMRWYKDENAFTPQIGNVSVSAPQPLVWWAFGDNPYQIKAETRVSLVVTPPENDFELQYLRGVIIYDGPDWNSKCLGNILQVFNSNRQLVSSGQYLSVRLLKPYYQTGRTMLIFQDYQNTKDIVQYQGFACVDRMNCGTVKMDGSQGLAAFSTVNDDITAEYVTQVSGSGFLEVYIGGHNIANLIATYTLDNTSSTYFPQEFLGYVRTYVLKGSSASVSLTRNSEDLSRNQAVGRKGFFASRYYKSGQPSRDQGIYDYIRAPRNQKFLYYFNIQEADFVGNTTLNVQVYNNGKNAFDQTFNATNKPSFNTAYQALGDGFSATFKTYGNVGNGFLLNYELRSGSGGFQLFTVMLITLFTLGR
ncbi:hypothetical protein L5515_011740 [Caenorhabditis briggsae]|uniref:CUB-like domain-containing protein n=1 Tax=Caenorhabditis briggsae TaxID=6238 RepID=A0AAE9EV75_CAEBR|nr:hypothetical protein L5515_011740 [Caenorhabditis briggsae]